MPTRQSCCLEILKEGSQLPIKKRFGGILQVEAKMMLAFTMMESHNISLKKHLRNWFQMSTVKAAFKLIIYTIMLI